MSRKIQRIAPVAVFDIETEAWDQFVCGSLLTVSGSLRSFTFKEERAFVEAILAIGTGDVFAHNGGRFDFLWFIDAMIRHRLLTDSMKITATESGSSALLLTITGPGLALKLRDSFRMFPISLARMGGKDSVGLDCEMRSDECHEAARLQRANGKPVIGCGGYCAIRRSMSKAAMRRAIEYCEQDCRALLDGLQRLIAFAEGDARLSLGATTGSTAWKTARAWGLIGPTPLTMREWWRIREAYYGGRVGLFRSSAPEGFHYDITSSYPHQCSQDLPDGEPILYHAPSDARRAYRAGKPGIYEAKITIPKDYWIPPLPFRAMINGEKRNAYPIGTFFGSWALPEIEYAESLPGVKVDPQGCVVFPESRHPFAPLMDHLIGLRLRFGKDTAEGILLKLWANSLYGKFAQEPATHRLVIATSAMDLGPGATPINESQTAWMVPYDRTPPIPDSSHVEKAAYITARGRIQLHRMLVARGGDDAIYCDTDSVFSTRERGPKDGIGKGLGTWADEGPFRNFDAIAPKLYRYDEDRGGKWKPSLKAKGIALTRDIDDLAAGIIWRTMKSGKPIVNRTGVLSLRSALRSSSGSLFQRRVMARAVAPEVSFGDRISDGSGGSRPPVAEGLVPFVRPRPREWNRG